MDGGLVWLIDWSFCLQVFFVMACLFICVIFGAIDFRIPNSTNMCLCEL